MFLKSSFNRLLKANNQLARLLHTSQWNSLKKIEKIQDPKTKTTTIEGKYLDSEKLFQSKVLNLEKQHKDSNDHDHTRPCAFCELEKRDIFVQYTDVLIIKQFLKEDGSVLPRKVTGLCLKQQRKLKVIAKHANLAGLTLNLQPNLIDGTKPSSDPRKRSEYLKWNHYFDDYEIMRKQFKYL